MAFFATEQLLGWATALGVGGLVGKLGDSWLKRRERREAERQAEPASQISANASFHAAVAVAAQELFSEYRQQLKFVRGRCDELEAKVDACEARHHACERNVEALEQRIVVLDRLMAAPVPPYIIPPPEESR